MSCDLTEQIKNLYGGNINQGEAEDAKNNLVSLFRTLERIETRQSKHKISITKDLTKKVAISYDNNGSSN